MNGFECSSLGLMSPGVDIVARVIIDDVFDLTSSPISTYHGVQAYFQKMLKMLPLGIVILAGSVLALLSILVISQMFCWLCCATKRYESLPQQSGHGESSVAFAPPSKLEFALRDAWDTRVATK
jgi:hypothetical protein